MSDKRPPNLYTDHSKLQTGFGPMTDKVLNSVLESMSSSTFKEQLTHRIIDPSAKIIKDKMRPYINIGIGMYLFLVFLLIVIIYLLIRKQMRFSQL